MGSSTDLLRIQEGKIDINELIQHVTTPASGGISMFIGITRNHEAGKKVKNLVYEMYDSMVMNELKRAVEHMRKTWHINQVAFVLRKGAVPPGEASIAICASQEHRKPAQEAVMWAIDAVKTKAPIWKKEIYEGGESIWKEYVDSSQFENISIKT